ncbi:putative disease resistance protein RGA3 [Chenopodium quinoa]|uniref:putative disease resistance protein RGA3 n=1 Tax=Chenopodium quinoa TaxID=63459 RepID=UPI000B788807|nr:putative disease resistance protein RGA3 [Chenopodium quinoa]
MEIGTAVSNVDSLSATLNYLRGKEFPSLHDCKSQIDRLLVAVSAARDVFLQVADAHELSEPQRSCIMELEGAVSDANRLLDNVVSRADRIQPGMVGGGLSKKVRLFCSRLNPHWVAYSISREVQKLRDKFDRILTNTCGIAPNNKPIREPQMCSYTCEDSYPIGREDDVEKVVGMLLDPSNVQRDVSFLSIVGIGGLGKTILARLVFNDPRVTDVFSLKMWICFTTQDQKQLDIDGILQKILASATRQNHEGATCQNHEGSTMDQVKSQLRGQLARHRYLLVLDYVWIDNGDQWRDLVKHLDGGQWGSCVLVTTRSKLTAEIIGADHMHMLPILSEENSWRLLKMLAFGSEINTPDNLVGVRQKIVNNCAGLPLAIRVVASLLGDQDKSKPQSLEEIGSAAIRESMDVIMAVDHYHHLESPLKSCFSYCYLFPKDFEIEKEKLKSLWMAQGYIVPLHEDQSIEDACEEYFSMLLNRSIFQDIKYDNYSQIVSCKINDIMYNISQHVAGKEMCVMNTICGKLDKDVRHLSVIGEKFDEYTLGKTHIHSYLHLDYDGIQVGKVSKSYLESLVANCLNLKALDLSGLIFESLPDSVCKLLELRYLNISGNTEMKFLPKSIAELRNLQTLILRRCHTLKELPAELIRLDNLRLLDIRYCFSLTCMPRGMGALTYLHNLSDYIVGGEHWNQLLDDLKPLLNLRGCLNIHIRWPKNVKVAEEDREQDGLCLGNTEHLNAILFDFIHDEADGSVGTEEAKRLIEKLQPHHNLKYLEVKKYHGLRMPGWVTLLSNLVKLHLTDCRELTYLPCLGNLLCLKVLRLIMLANLECIGEDSPSVDSSSTFMPQLSITGLPYLPPLETLEMSNLPKLKGWRRGVEDDHQFLNDSSSNKADLQLLPCFSDLKSLFIWNCPELTCFPSCPKMEDLTLLNFNSRMQMIINCERDVNLEVVIPFASSSSWSPHSEHLSAIKKVTISNVSWLNSVPVEAFQFVESLEIWGNKELGSLGEAENVFRGCSSSLRYLMISNCCTLRSVVPGGLEHLTALEKLEIRNCNNLRISEEHQEEGVKCIGIAINDILPLPSNHHSLRTLTLHGLPQLVNLPNWMQFLPALQSLEISFCNRLKSMPNWMPNLQSLTHLTVSGCSKNLERRCQQDPPGKDWPYIKHIPNIQFQECFY